MINSILPYSWHVLYTKCIQQHIDDNSFHIYNSCKTFKLTSNSLQTEAGSLPH